MAANAQIRIWDPWVRLFHWLLVTGVLVLFVLEESIMALHLIVGYAVFGLLCFRVIWGWIGPGHARFRDFVRSPQETWAYLGKLRSGQAERFLGHNPAGGMMIVMLMSTLLVTILFGMLAQGAEQSGGWLAWMAVSVGGAHAKWFEEAHELFAGVLMLLVVLHLGGVLFSSWHQKENLIKSMITGCKPLREDGP